MLRGKKMVRMISWMWIWSSRSLLVFPRTTPQFPSGGGGPGNLKLDKGSNPPCMDDFSASLEGLSRLNLSSGAERATAVGTTQALVDPPSMDDFSASLEGLSRLNLSSGAERTTAVGTTQALADPPSMDDFSASLEGLSRLNLSSGAERTTAVGTTQEQEVIVDGLNFLSFFCPSKEPGYAGEATPWELFATTHKRVRAFLRGCKLANLKPTFVVDCGGESEEVEQKWMDRREEEVLLQKRNMPCDVDTTLAVLLKEENAEVYLPKDLDADDVVANLAKERSAFILSGDRDMVRYIGLDRHKNKIFVTFAFSHDGSIKLVPRDDFEIHDRETRELRTVSTSDLKSWVVKNVNVNKLLMLQKSKFIRGNADSFTKRVGNLHMIARPLRQAVYSRLGRTSVHEFVPTWDAVGCSVVWVDESVEADKALDALLDDPRKAMAWLVEADALAESVLSDFEKVSRSHSRSMIIAEYMECCSTKPGFAMAFQNRTFSRLELAQYLDPSFKSVAYKKDADWKGPPDYMIYKLCTVCRNFPSNRVSGECEYFWEKNYSFPKRCKRCSKASKARRGGGSY